MDGAAGPGRRWLRGGATGARRRWLYAGASHDALCLLLAVCALLVFAHAKTAVVPGFTGPVTFDGHFYAWVGDRGYEFNGRMEVKQNISFLPLMAMAIEAARTIIPGDWPLAEVAALGFVILLGTLMGLHRLASTVSGSSTATVAVVLWAFSPLAFYNFVGYADPLYALLTVWSLLFLARRQHWGACLLAGLAVLARPQAFVLVAFVAAMVLWTHRDRWRSILTTCVPLQLAAMVVPVMAFATYCAIEFGDSAVYVNSLEAWRNGSFLDGNLPFWKAVPYFIEAVSAGSPSISMWTALLASLALVLTFSLLLFALDGPRMIVAFHLASVAFLFLSISFDALNVARHVLFLVTWVILAAGAHVRSVPGWWGRWPLLLAWILVSTAINVTAVGRYFRGEWVS